MKKNQRVNPRKKNKKENEEVDLPGYPTYPENEDVYTIWDEEKDLNPEDPTQKKAPNEKPNTLNEKNFEGDVSGEDLDIPGSELDDEQEDIGSEDEENNYYSIGGDNHNNLDESTRG